MKRAGGEILVGMLVATVLAVMLVPMSAGTLDVLLAVSVSSAFLVLVVALSVERPLDFSVFPTLLLVTTLFRLGLNVASTRLILLEGHSGSRAAGRIVGAFGNIVVGGNIIVGLVIFLILVVINFIVITKGAGRIAEVSARFVLDALPGKQMGVDAELAAGSLTDSEARKRRREIEQEADFYGAMDGASKFVRGDAIAGLIITGINIVGGLVVGTLQHSMSAGDAVARFSVLTIGDGLVSQVPSLLISTAAGAVVTRAATGDALAPMLGKQLFGSRLRVRFVAAAVLLMGLAPGMPLILFAAIAGVLLGIAQFSTEPGEEQEDPQPVASEPERSSIDEALHLDRLQLDVGYGLVSLVDVEHGAEIEHRLQMVRRQIANDLGVVIPSVHICDDLQIGADSYVIRISGGVVARGQLRQGKHLAMSPGDDGLLAQLVGEDTTEPAFGLPARWIDREQLAAAERLGLTTVDAATVLTTHLSEVISQHAAELLGRQEVHDLIERVREQNPKLVEDLIPGVIGVGDVHAVLRDLLVEGVSIRDLRTILEGLAEVAPTATRLGDRTAAVRQRLARQICEPFSNETGEMWAAFLDRGLEHTLRQSLVNYDTEPQLSPDLGEAKNMLDQIQQLVPHFETQGSNPLVLVAADLRRPLRDFLRRFTSNVGVITHRELPTGIELRALGVIETLAKDNPGPPALEPAGGIGAAA